jgi:dTDP-4-dehydrorhamnose reductase
VTAAGGPRVLVLGATGMLGHKVWQVAHERFQAWATTRGGGEFPGLFEPSRLLTDVRADDQDSIVRACGEARPDVIVNCVGIVKQRPAAGDPVPSLIVNALLPHRLAALARAMGARLLHISTDCVFAGTRGGYREDDSPDASDLYGRSKLLGEVSGQGCLTLRTSIIGRELSSSSGLLEWFLAQRGGRASGYRQARFSGLTTGALAKVIAELIARDPGIDGLYHVASEPIAKYDLLCRLNAAFDARVEIEPSDEVRIDRSLDGSRFAAATGIDIPGWDTMIRDMAADPTPYDEWRRRRV